MWFESERQVSGFLHPQATHHSFSYILIICQSLLDQPTNLPTSVSSSTNTSPSKSTLWTHYKVIGRMKFLKSVFTRPDISSFESKLQRFSHSYLTVHETSLAFGSPIPPFFYTLICTFHNNSDFPLIQEHLNSNFYLPTEPVFKSLFPRKTHPENSWVGRFEDATLKGPDDNSHTITGRCRTSKKSIYHSDH